MTRRVEDTGRVRSTAGRHVVEVDPAAGATREAVALADGRGEPINPQVTFETVEESVSDANGETLVAGCTAIVGVALLFTERLAAAVRGRRARRCRDGRHGGSTVHGGAGCAEWRRAAGRRHRTGEAGEPGATR